MTKRILLGQRVIIDWMDTQTHFNCQENLAKCGLAEDKDVIKIASTRYTEDNTPADVTVIPRPNVVRVRGS